MEGEAQAHHDGQPGTDAPDRVELDQRADTGDEHRGLDEQGRVDGGERLAVVHGDARDQHDGRDICHEHGQHVLQAEGDGFADRHASVEPVDVVDGGRCAGSLVFHL